MYDISDIGSDLKKRRKKKKRRKAIPCDCSIYSTNQYASILMPFHAKSRKRNGGKREKWEENMQIQ